MDAKHLLPLVFLAACGSENSQPSIDLVNRAYVVSYESPELTVIDLKSQSVIGKVNTLGRGNHMVETGPELEKVYVTSSETDEIVVVDTRKLEVTSRLKIGRHPTHLAISKGEDTIYVMVEGDESITAIDTATDTVRGTLAGFYTPHNIRFSEDGKTGYVANAAAHHVTVVDLASFTIRGEISLDGFAVPTLAENEGGFHDAQVDRNGVLYAAHMNTGKVLIYDTRSGQKQADLQIGPQPWSVFADHPFDNVPMRAIAASFGDAKLSIIEDTQIERTLDGDSESYGVNFTSLAPDRAYVMNRNRRDITVIDTATGAEIERLMVGGNTETASTSADGKYIVATVSSANRVVIIDAASGKIEKFLDDVGTYPWAVTIPLGQNYCH